MGLIERLGPFNFWQERVPDCFWRAITSLSTDQGCCYFRYELAPFLPVKKAPKSIHFLPSFFFTDAYPQICIGILFSFGLYNAPQKLDHVLRWICGVEIHFI